ncbi:MAG: TIGR02281 family clan AA aspartic protease, partial [Hyphomicrobiales bacterium]|nr:TIGR02281 family clan AA aspartic protease [Hyphomicrobiales bacterium]
QGAGDDARPRRGLGPGMSRKPAKRRARSASARRWPAFVAPAAILALALGALVLTPARRSLLGLDHERFAALASLAALATWILGVGLSTPSRRRVSGRALIVAAILSTLATLGWKERFVLAGAADRLVGATPVRPAKLAAKPPAANRGVAQAASRGKPAGRTFSLKRGADGQFTVEVSIGGRSLPFLLDTGATLVTLRAEDAAAIGWGADKLSFDARIATANGEAKAAPLVLPDVRVGGIVVHDVQALVAAPGALDRDLLGMSFLEKLDGYSVFGDRLTMQAK